MQEKTKQSIHLAYVRTRCTFPLRCWQRGISCSCRSVQNLVQEHHVYKYVPVRRIPYKTCRSSRGTLKFGQQLAYLCKLYIPLGNSGMMMMADSSQTRIWGRLMVSSCMLAGGYRGRFSMRTTYRTLGKTKVWAEDDWDAARSFSLLRFPFTPSRLSASNLQMAFLTDERRLSRSEVSCCHDGWLILACASCLFSWSL